MASPDQRPWVPKQFPTMDGQWYQTIGGSTTKDVAAHIMTLLDPIPANTTLHDAAAGQAPFTDALLDVCPPTSLPTLKIHLSDISPQMLNFARMTISSHNAADKAIFSELDACDLSTFPDSHFTLTALTFGLAIMPSPQKAAAEMYRTLVAGGTAVSAFWSQQPTGFSLTDAHYAMRAPGRKMKLEPPKESLDPEVLRGYMESGGFRDVKMHFHPIVLDVPDIRHYVHSLWPIIGEPEDGWKQEDEDNWEACVDKGVEILRQAKGVTDLGGGHVSVEMIAMIAIAKK